MLTLTSKLPAFWSIALSLLIVPFVAHSEPEDEELTLLPSTQVAAQVIESRLDEAEASTSLTEEAKSRLVELYRKALGNLKSAETYAEKAAAYKRAGESASAEISALHRQLTETAAAAAEQTIAVNPSSSLNELEQVLQKEKAELAAAEAGLSDVDNRLKETEDRPAVIAQRFSEARRLQEEAAAQLKLPPTADEGPRTAEVMRWVLETRYNGLSAEISALEQELISQPARLDLLQARREAATVTAEQASGRVRQLEEVISRKRKEEADQVVADAQVGRLQAAGKHPLVIQVAEQNALLSEEIAAMTSPMRALTDQTERTMGLARQIEDDLSSARESIEIGGLSQELGHMLMQRNQSLPDLRVIRQESEEREARVAEIGVSRLQHRAEAKPLRNLNDYVARLVESTDEGTPGLREQLTELGSSRRELLERAIESDDAYLRMLAELGTAQQRLLGAVEDFDRLLDQNLLWVRSASRTELRELGALPDQLGRVVSPVGWYEVVRTLSYQARHAPAFGLLLVLLLVLLWARRRMVVMINALGRKVNNPVTDRFGLSIITFVLTLVIAAAWPLVVAVTGWQLRVSPETTSFANAVGEALRLVAVQFFFIRAFWWMCIPHGLAASHFRWSEHGLRVRRIELNRFGWIYLPALLVTSLSYYLDPLNAGWVVGRAAFAVMVSAVAFAFYRILHPTRGVLAGYLQQVEHRTFQRLYRLFYPLLVAIPLAIGVLSVIGYVYTAGVFLVMLLQSAWMVVGLVMLNALVQRWLQVTHRRLCFEVEAEQRLAATEAGGEQIEQRADEEELLLDSGDTEEYLETLSDTTRELVNTVVFALGLVGLWFIWADVFPAFAILDDVTLWHYTETVDGEARRVAVTLADIGLALVYILAAMVLIKKLPAVLEIVLMEYFDMPAGTRYAVTTLTTYSIIAVGILLVLNTVGAQWSQLQWLIAALSVGIGFGLQEIVANFISGIIILFERPIRVGDFVTVGETDGVVTKIRIRATTIRSRENKELLVPNKEFITGRLLNWSLSDQSIRVVVIVGVAYGTDVDKALELMKQAAEENEHVLEDPGPAVSFEGFGDNALTLLLRAPIRSVDHRVSTITELHKAVNRKFTRAGISIAFPQRDVHLDTHGPLRVTIEPNAVGPV